MEVKNPQIDSGKAFDWGRTSEDYAKYRDIYPLAFYEKIVKRGLCIQNQKVLDLGTGTGVLPRNMYHYGAKWVGIDSSANQIAQARKCSDLSCQNIEYLVASAEEMSFSEHSFDVITACQSFWYFDYELLTPKLSRILKQDGAFLLLSMVWLPFEDKIAAASEELILSYNPTWSGAGEVKRPITLPPCVYETFKAVFHEEYELDVPFTRETWHGRMKACRGVGASLSPPEIEKWEREHRLLLQTIAPEAFSVKHYAAMLELRKR